MLQPVAVMWCEMNQKAWMMTTTYAWSCKSLQFLMTAAHDHAIVIVTLTCSHPLLLHSDKDMPCLHNASRLVSQRTVAMHTCNTLHPAATKQSKILLQHRVAVSSYAVEQIEFCLQAHKNWVQCVSWSPDAAMVVSGDQNGVLWLWQPKTGETIGACRGTPPFFFACLNITVHLISSYTTMQWYCNGYAPLYLGIYCKTA